SLNALNNKKQQLGLCNIQNIAIQRHPPKEGTVPSDIDSIQESIAMVTTPTDVIRLPQHTTYMSAPTTYNNRRQTETQSRRHVSWTHPIRQRHSDGLAATISNTIHFNVYKNCATRPSDTSCMTNSVPTKGQVLYCHSPQQVQLKERNVQFTQDGVQKSFAKVKTLANKHVSQHNTSTITSNVYEQKIQSTKHLYAQDLKLSSQHRHITQKFASKSICGQQDKV
nr:hypothetical protein [Tanacetum cinerariifolium]